MNKAVCSRIKDWLYPHRSRVCARSLVGAWPPWRAVRVRDSAMQQTSSQLCIPARRWPLGTRWDRASWASHGFGREWARGEARVRWYPCGVCPCDLPRHPRWFGRADQNLYST